MNRVLEVENEISELRNQLQNHKLYNSLKSIDDIKVFMEYHVFAIWSFALLLNNLQINMTEVRTSSISLEKSTDSVLINETVLEEEIETNKVSQTQSHFEIYFDAMRQADARTNEINNFIKLIQFNNSVNYSLNKTNIDKRVADFVKFSFSVTKTNKPHLIASALIFGQEEVIPGMFIEILRNVDSENKFYNKLKYYLQGHIDLDIDKQRPLSIKIVSEICNNNQQKWDETITIAKQSLEKRIALWDAINHLVQKEKFYA